MKQVVRYEYLTEEEKNIEFEENFDLINRIATKFTRTVRIDYEELYSVASEGLVKALNSYNKAYDVCFTHYAHKCMVNELLMFTRKEYRHLDRDCSLNIKLTSRGKKSRELSDMIEDNNERGFAMLESDFEIADVINSSISLLTKPEQLMINKLYGLNNYKKLTQQEVADEIGVTQPCVGKRRQRILAVLKQIIIEDQIANNDKNNNTFDYARPMSYKLKIAKQ